MRFKSLRVLLVVLGVLVVIAVVYTVGSRGPRVRKPFANKDFRRIEIKAKDTLCALERVGENWKLVTPVEYPVDTGMFYNFLRGLKDLEVGEVVSKREEKHADFEVGEKGVEVKVYQDKESTSVIIGEMAGDFMHWYLRFPPGKETYLSSGLSKYMVDREPNDWRDHTIFSFDTATVKEVHLGEQKFVRKDTSWMMGEEEISPQKYKPILSLLSNMKTDDFGEADFEPEFEVKIVFEGGEEKILYIGEKENNKYPAKVEGTSTIFLLNSWRVDRLKSL